MKKHQVSDMQSGNMTTDDSEMLASHRVHRAIESISRGGLVVVADDEDRENEGDLIGAAELMTEEAVAFMVRYSTGILCVAIDNETANRLALPPMVGTNEDPNGTAYTVSCDATASGTGVSARDRLLTMKVLASPTSVQENLRRPGHVFPLRRHPDGVLGRNGHTEAASDLVLAAGCSGAAVLSELVNDDGSMMTGATLAVFCDQNKLPFLTIKNIVAWRRLMRVDGHG